MTFEELMNQGKAELSERRAKETANRQAVAAKQAAKRAEFADAVVVGIKNLLPLALWDYIEIPETHVGAWNVPCEINAPGCGPIRVEYLPNEKKFNGGRIPRPYTVRSACEGGYFDWNELYEPYYAESGDIAETISEALALAAEQHDAMMRYESEYGLLLAEYEAKQAAAQAAKVEQEYEIEDAPAPTPTMADRLEAIIRDMVRAEVGAYTEGGY